MNKYFQSSASDVRQCRNRVVLRANTDSALLSSAVLNVLISDSLLSSIDDSNSIHRLSLPLTNLLINSGRLIELSMLSDSQSTVSVASGESALLVVPDRETAGALVESALQSKLIAYATGSDNFHIFYKWRQIL